MYRRTSKYSKNNKKNFFLFRPLHFVFIYRRLVIIVLLPTYNITQSTHKIIIFKLKLLLLLINFAKQCEQCKYEKNLPFGITASTKVFETLLFHSQPIFRKFKLLAKEEEKCPESAFKLLFYSIAYGYCFHLLFSGKYDFFHETKNCWRGKCFNTRVSQF